MKYSKYNVLFDSNNSNYIFNTKTLAIMEIDSEIKTLVEEDKILESAKEKDAFLENGLLVGDCDDELLQLKKDYWSSVCSEEVLFLSVMTTLDCNLRCTYCFEHHAECYMTPDMASNILSFIEDKINCTNLQVIKIDWYGGEPTLNIEIIKNLSEKVIRLCQENHITYIASITTNATLLSDRNIQILKAANISHMQITVDGPKEVHDRRRIYRNGNGTFETIIENIKKIYRDFNIVIRINIDQTNGENVDLLLQYLVMNGLKEIPISIKGVVSSEERDVSKLQYADRALSDIIWEKNKFAQELGIKTAIMQFFDIQTDRFCIVDCINQFIISPDGRLFKCGESYLDEDKGLCGRIDPSNGSFEINTNQFQKWVKDPFEDKECISCKLLPMCFGGCQMKRNVKQTKPCNMDLKYHLSDYLKLYLTCISRGEEIEEV